MPDLYLSLCRFKYQILPSQCVALSPPRQPASWVDLHAGAWRGSGCHRPEYAREIAILDTI